MDADATSHTWKINVPANQVGVNWRLANTGNVSTARTGTITSSQSGSTIDVTVSFAANTASSERTITATFTYGNSGTLTQASSSVPCPAGSHTVNGIVVAGANLKSSGVFESSATAYGGYYEWDDAISGGNGNYTGGTGPTGYCSKGCPYGGDNFSKCVFRPRKLQKKTPEKHLCKLKRKCVQPTHNDNKRQHPTKALITIFFMLICPLLLKHPSTQLPEHWSNRLPQHPSTEPTQN